mgnify:CR=1 FL=1
MRNPYLVGKGPHHVIVVHGWFGSASAWEPLARVLDTERFTYAFMDCRGYGERRSETGPFTMQAIADDVLALADTLGWSEFHLIGHSMGGKAIQQVLHRAPQRVSSLIAVTPVPASGVPFDDSTWALFESAANSPEARAGIINHSTGNRLSAHWVQQIAQHSLEHSSHEAFAGYLPSWVRGDISQGLQGLTQPTLVIVGEHDPGLTAEVMQVTYLQLYPNAQLHTIANAGHYPMDETPVALATVIEAFIAGLD